MNREIKFRAWLPDSGEMIDINNYDSDEYNFTIGKNGIIVEYFEEVHYEGGGEDHVRYEWKQIENAVILQYTGLKDKSGKEIYEGDILRELAKDEWEKKNFSCFEVFFHDGDANSDYNIGWSISRMHSHGAICGGYIPSFKPKTTKKMVKIGNVFQNQELLK